MAPNHSPFKIHTNDVLNCPFVMGSKVRIHTDDQFRINEEWLYRTETVIELDEVLRKGKCCAIKGRVIAEDPARKTQRSEVLIPSIVLKAVYIVSADDIPSGKASDPPRAG